MIQGWDNAPLISVPLLEDKPKQVTLIYPYYRNRKFFQYQLSVWNSYSELLKPYLNLIIVDDGSPEGEKASEILKLNKHPIPIRLFEIEVDVRFNWIAARNIAMHFANGWCLGTDMDHVIPERTAYQLVWGNHNENVIYRLSRIEHDGKRIHPHPNTWFMTKEMFWKFGGYDERFSGLYGSDGDARRRWAIVAKVYTLKYHLVRHEYQDDSSTTNYKRKLPSDNPAVLEIIRSRGKGWQPKVLSFPYHEVNLHA